ncbi:MAG: TatD family hydrolase [Amphritea sp.]
MNTDQQALKLIDIGVNLTDSCFDKDRDEVLKAAATAGVSTLIITGTTLEESQQAIDLCQQHAGSLFCTVGVHPHYSKNFTSTTLSDLKSMLQTPGVVAVGETGLDFNRNFSTQEQQITAFEAQLELACETGLPLFLHERDAHQKQLEMLHSYRDHFGQGVAHCFTGSKQELYNYLDLDLHIGITGWVCDERRGSHLHPLLKDIPANRLMLETDAPYLLPRNLKPKPKSRRNLPQYLPHILKKVAYLVEKPIDQLAHETVSTSIDFFGLSQPV